LEEGGKSILIQVLTINKFQANGYLCGTMSMVLSENISSFCWLCYTVLFHWFMLQARLLFLLI